MLRRSHGRIRCPTNALCTVTHLLSVQVAVDPQALRAAMLALTSRPTLEDLLTSEPVIRMLSSGQAPQLSATVHLLAV